MVENKLSENVDEVIAVASDHAGFDLKKAVCQFLLKSGYKVMDLGPETGDRVDYPDFGYKVADIVANGTAKFGVAICGSGIGISIAANRNKNIRAALCMTKEMASLARKHNDANIIALGARLINEEQAFVMIEEFLKTDFEGGRHEQRVKKLCR